MRDLYGSGDLVTPGERALREHELRGEAIGEMLRGYHDVTAAPAMEAGSAAAYSAIVQAQLQDPKIALAAEANAKLDELIGLTRINTYGRGQQVGKMLGSTGTPW